MLALAARLLNLMVKKNTKLLFLMNFWIRTMGWTQLGSPDLGSALLFFVRGDGMAGTDCLHVATHPPSSRPAQAWWPGGGRDPGMRLEVS